MAELINLRTARKQAKRRQVDQRANANRATHGRTKTERKLATARSEKLRHDLDRHRIEPGDGR